MALTLRQVEDVCLYMSGSKECRFLGEDGKKLLCLKQTPDRAKIDKEIEDFKKEQKGLGINPYSLDKPMGDNCPGYLYLTSKLQGYDTP